MCTATSNQYLTIILLLAYTVDQLVLPNILEESWGVHHIQFVQKLREVPLNFKHKLSVYFGCTLICHILQLGSFHVNNYFDLIDTFLIDEFFTISKFVSPCVLQFFNKEMD